MTFENVMSLLGGLALFLYGMNVMSNGLEKRAGNKLKLLLGKMTSNKIVGFFLGFVITVILQSSSASTVMTVGLVNSGLMTLEQSVPVILGANLGATVTPWILSLSGIQGDSFFTTLIDSATFTPIMALIGVVMYVFLKKQKRRDTGLIFLGFAVLMFGMEMMSGAVSGLGSSEGFSKAMVLFRNPLMGLLVGIVLTAIIQSSGASIGILQSLSVTGEITFSLAMPIIMGQNIGTCITAILACAGTNKDAKRSAVIHLAFNVISAIIFLPLWLLLVHFWGSSWKDTAALSYQIALMNTLYKLLATALFMTCTKILVRLSKVLIKDSPDEGKERFNLLDMRFLKTPAVAIERSRNVTNDMAALAITGMRSALKMMNNYAEETAEEIREEENLVDRYEDKLGEYLVHLSREALTDEDAAEVGELLRIISDLERISDHSVDFVTSLEELNEKKINFSDEAKRELTVITGALDEILSLALEAFCERDLKVAEQVEPLEQVIDRLEELIKKNHIDRLRRSECSIELGFILSDILGNLERVSDHCSNIAGYVLETARGGMSLHEYFGVVKGGTSKFNETYSEYAEKYKIS